MSTIYEKEVLLSQVHEELAELKNYLDASVGQTALHEVEQRIFRQVLSLGQSLLSYFIAASGSGYEAGHPLLSEAGEPMEYKGTVDSPYLSIFGKLTIPRAAYAHPSGGYVYPVDGQLNLPDRQYSYLVQRWLQAGATEMDFAQAVERFNPIFGSSFLPEGPHRLGPPIAAYVDPFYQQIDPPQADTEGSHIGLSADGKGVRLFRSERDPERTAEEPAKVRLGKGEKNGVKKEAVVTVDFSFDPEARDPEALVKALLKQYTPAARRHAPAERRHRHQQGLPPPRQAFNVHRRATLEGKESAFRRLMERVIRRDPDGEKKLVVLLDSDPHLETMLRWQLNQYHLTPRLDAIILDIMHVSEYIRSMATALHGEKSPPRPGWVEDKLRALLQGRVGRVIGGLKQIQTQNPLSPHQHQALDQGITYFENHRHMMDYATYLEKGYPIATGLVEGTCGSLVGDRMEQSGMRWSLAGAQAVLDQRAVMKNDDWDDFGTFYIEEERKRLYPTSYERAA